MNEGITENSGSRPSFSTHHFGGIPMKEEN